MIDFDTYLLVATTSVDKGELFNTLKTLKLNRLEDQNSATLIFI